MPGMRKWKLEIGSGNEVTIAAPSRTKAKQAYKEMFGGMGRLISIEDVGPAPETIEQLNQRCNAIRSPVKPVNPIKVKDRKQRPNERCACGSGKKFKRCHGIAKSHRAKPVRPVQPGPPAGEECDLRDVPSDDLPEVQGEG